MCISQDTLLFCRFSLSLALGRQAGLPCPSTLSRNPQHCEILKGILSTLLGQHGGDCCLVLYLVIPFRLVHVDSIMFSKLLRSWEPDCLSTRHGSHFPLTLCPKYWKVEKRTPERTSCGTTCLEGEATGA